MMLRTMTLVTCSSIGAFLLAGCDKGSAGPPEAVPGALELRLAGPAPAGAVLVAVTGGPVLSVAAGAGMEAFSVNAGGAVVVGVVGDAVSGAVALLNVPDVNSASRYQAVIRQIAEADNTQRTDLQAFSASVVRAP